MTISTICELIKNPAVAELLDVILALLPDYWWHIAASTSGKYHPAFSLGEGGLVRHSVTVAYFARRIAIAQGMSEYWQDILTASGLIHDGFKCGRSDVSVEEAHTVHEHPALMAEFLRAKDWSALYRSPELDQVADDLAHVIESHMGQWTTSKYSEVVLTAPQDEYQRALSAADMVAATKELAMVPDFFEEEV